MAGGAILHACGLTVDDFCLVGGLLVPLIALSMLHGSPSTQHALTTGDGAALFQAESVAIYTLTMPLLVGPGAIATLVVLGQSAFHEGWEIALAPGVLGFLAVLATASPSAPFIGHYLSPRVTAITQRLMGMILAAIAMQMIVASLQAFSPWFS